VETFTVALVGMRSRAWNGGVVGDETVALVGVFLCIDVSLTHTIH